MATPSVQAIHAALQQPDKIRNVCVIAHVDHGKTSLCDHLIASNGYLSKRSAGTARYMDAREDEQNRMITIKSSAIPLVHNRNGEVYLVNLVDSPGHIDFSVEVSAAARLCDGGLLVVDVLEGFQSQSRMVMRQAWKEGLAIILVLSKMDRLVTEARLSPSEIYHHIRDLLENINAYLHQCVSDAMITDDVDEIDLVVQERSFSPERGNVIFASAVHGWAFTMSHFATALAERLIEQRPPSAAMPCVKSLATKLQKAFWGDYFLDRKSGQVLPGKKIKSDQKLNIACQYVFQPLVEIYSVSERRLDAEKARLLLRKLKIPESVVTDRALSAMLAKPTDLAGQIMALWTPCAKNCLDCIIDQCPSPTEALPRRLAEFGGSNALTTVEKHQVVYIAKSMSADITALRLTGDKLHGREHLTDFVGFGRVFSGSLKKGDELLVCDQTAEITLQSTTQENSNLPSAPPVNKRIVVQDIYVPAGMDLLAVDEVGTGAVVALAFSFPGAQVDEARSLFERSLQSTADWLLHMKAQKKPLATNHEETEGAELVGFNPVDRCVTLSNSPEINPFDSVYRRHTAGILRFGVSPQSLGDWPGFMRGLALLYRADPAVHIDILDSGEFILCCQGQVHAERALQDLNQLYCPEIKLKVTPPLIAIRETLINPPAKSKLSAATLALPFPPWALSPQVAPPGLSQQTVVQGGESNVGIGRSGNMIVKVLARPMPAEALVWMDAAVDGLHAAFHDHRIMTSCLQWLSVEPEHSVESHRISLADVQEAARVRLHPLLEPSLRGIEQKLSFSQICVAADSRTALYVDGGMELSQAAITAMVSGFQSASRSGPYCEEPVRGVIFIVLSVLTALPQVQSSPHLSREPYTSPADCAMAPLKTNSEDPEELIYENRSFCSSGHYASGNLGVLIGCTRLACRSAMEIRGAPRVFELMLNLEVVCDEASLGRIHALLGQRRAHVVQEDMYERTLEFRLVAKIPSTETWDLSVEIRKRSSGKASVSFSVEGWELNSQDPFPEAIVTEEEEEDEGVNLGITNVQNLPRTLIMAVRKRKGLATGEKIMTEGADKQRNLGKSK